MESTPVLRGLVVRMCGGDGVKSLRLEMDAIHVCSSSFEVGSPGARVVSRRLFNKLP